MYGHMYVCTHFDFCVIFLWAFLCVYVCSLVLDYWALFCFEVLFFQKASTELTYHFYQVLSRICLYPEEKCQRKFILSPAEPEFTPQERPFSNNLSNCLLILTCIFIKSLLFLWFSWTFSFYILWLAIHVLWSLYIYWNSHVCWFAGTLYVEE